MVLFARSPSLVPGDRPSHSTIHDCNGVCSVGCRDYCTPLGREMPVKNRRNTPYLGPNSPPPRVVPRPDLLGMRPKKDERRPHWLRGLGPAMLRGSESADVPCPTCVLRAGCAVPRARRSCRARPRRIVPARRRRWAAQLPDHRRPASRQSLPRRACAARRPARPCR